jgi:biopolymer transport protein ExbB/TolQ
MDTHIILQAITDTPKLSPEFWLAIFVEITALIIIVWRASIAINKKITQISENLTASQKEIGKVQAKQEKMEERIDKIETDFNHRFTEYKDFVRDLIETKMEALSKKLENSTTCTSKKLTQIEKTLAFIKGAQKIRMSEDHD